MIKKYRGRTKFMEVPVLVSCPAWAGSLMRMLSGYACPALGSGSPGGPQGQATTTIIGVLTKTILSTDEDYATARNVIIEVPIENYVEWEIDVYDTVVAADVGLYIDLYDASTAARGTSVSDTLQVVQRLSANKAVVVLNMGTSGFGSVGAA